MYKILIKSNNASKNRYLNCLIDPSFQGVNRVFDLLFSDGTVRIGNRRSFLPNVKIEDYNIMIDGQIFFGQDYNIMIDGQIFFGQSVKSDMGTYDNIWQFATCQGDDYTVAQGDDYLLDYPYFKHYYNLIAIDFCKQQALDTDTIAIQQITFTGNLNQRRGSTMCFVIQEAK